MATLTAESFNRTLGKAEACMSTLVELHIQSKHNLAIVVLSKSLQIAADEFSKRVGEPTPESLSDLFDAIFQGHSVKAVVDAAVAANSTRFLSVAEALQVVIKEYRDLNFGVYA
jgi:hypothetical protein